MTGNRASTSTSCPTSRTCRPTLRNQPVVSIFFCHAGTVAGGGAGDRALPGAPPALDVVEPMPYTTLQGLSDEVLPPDQRNYWKAENLDGLSNECVGACVNSGAVDLAVTSPLGVVALYPKGRAITRWRRSAALDGRALAVFGVCVVAVASARGRRTEHRPHPVPLPPARAYSTPASPPTSRARRTPRRSPPVVRGARSGSNAWSRSQAPATTPTTRSG